MQVPQSLVNNGRLILHDIYRTANLNEQTNNALVKGKVSDNFPQIIPNNPWDGSGVLPHCNQALANGNIVSSDQCPTLQVWHAGLSCQLLLKLRQGILFGLDHDENFMDEFNNRSRSQILRNETGSYRILLVYKLQKGSAIPDNIGIELDGENHICLYPIGVNLAVSDIEDGLSSFTIDALRPLQASWRPFAVMQVRASGFNFPMIEFPPDSDDVFPFRRWLTSVINNGDSDIALNASKYTEEYIDGSLALFEYLSKMLSIARSYGVDCSFDDIEMNLCISKALSFALNVNLLFKTNTRMNFMLKSTDDTLLKEDTATERKVVSKSWCNDLQTTSRSVLAIDGGRSVVSKAASINLLYIDARLGVLVALPFKVVVDNNVEVLFDKIELSPVVESFELDIGDSSDKCESIVESFSGDSVRSVADNYGDNICIEASVKNAFLVQLTAEEKTKFMQGCLTCFGYNSNKQQQQVRCKHKRRALQGERVVWCYHHKYQEQEYNQRFRLYGDPDLCVWWEDKL